MKRRILVLTLLFCMVLGLSLTAQAQTVYDEVDEPVIDGKYYLCATVDGTDYYYRVTSSTLSESVTDTSPYSFYVTDDPDDKGIKEFTLTALAQGFYMGYASGESIHKIYSMDVDKDDVLDTGLNSGLDAARHCFYWDAKNQQIFTMRGGVKYVLAVKTLRNVKTGNEELHMLSVPASELEGDDPAYPVRFVKKHICQFAEAYTSNEHSHWYACDCGEKDSLQLHQVDAWTVTKEAIVGAEGSRTGKCTVCGEEAVESIPALKDNNAETQPAEDAEGQEQPAAPVNPALIVAACAMAVVGIVILIFGNRKKKQ